MSAHRHVAPELWAELAAGRLDGERAMLEAAAASCPRCAADRAKVEAARTTMRAITDAGAPSMPWDSIGTRLGWALAADERARSARATTRRSVLWASLAAGLAAAAVVTVVVTRRPAPPVAAPAPPPPTPTEPALAAVVPAAPSPISGLVTIVERDATRAATLDGAPLTLASRVVAGSTLVTTHGRVAVQLGPRDGFVVAANTHVRAVALDDQNVELALEAGALDLELVHRSSTQRFAVVAGTRRVEVRGTAFHVERDATHVVVSCTRGRVAVIDGEATVEVPAGTILRLPATPGLAGAQPVPLEALALDVEEVPLLRGFTTSDDVAASTGGLEITAPRGVLRLDGHLAGMAPIALRVDPGRHLVEVGGISRWLEVDAGATASAALVGAPPKSERPTQLDAALGKVNGALESCARAPRKVDPTFAGELEVEIGIRADGALDYVTPVRGIGDRDVEACVLDALRDRLTLPAGSAGRVRKTIKF